MTDPSAKATEKQLLSYYINTAGISLCLLFLCQSMRAQQSVAEADKAAWADDFSLFVADEGVDEATVADWFEQISSVAEQRLDINTASMEQLMAVPFLTKAQVESIGDHIGRYGYISSAAELLAIPEIDRTTATMLGRIFSFQAKPSAEPLSVSDKLLMARHEAVFTANVPFYTTYGDRSAFLGPRYKHSLRYTMSLNHHFEAGLVASQDAGEPFFAGRNKWGYDHYSPFFVVYGKRLLSTLAVGNYRIRMGMGLVINNNYSFGKTAWRQSSGYTRQSIRPHSSRSSANFMQGAAAELRLAGRLRLTLFASSRRIDATPAADSSSIRTILTTGYHRTATEMSHKGIARLSAAGTNLRFDGTGWHVGVTAMASHLSRRLTPDKSALYRKYNPEGSSFWNASADYGFRRGRVSVEGETATGSCGGVATINTLVYSPASHIDMQLSLRHYSARYSSLFANAFGNSSDARDETGALFGLTWNVSTRWLLRFYTDYAYSPQPRYGISAASSQWDNYLNLTQYASRCVVTTLYRVQLRQRDNDLGTRLKNYTEQRLRLRIASYDRSVFGWYLQGDASMSTRKGKSVGLMLSGMGSVRLKWLRVKAIAGWFHTDDYYSRLYASDGGLLYSLSMPMVYGHGARGSLLISTYPMPQLTLTARLSATKYFDRDIIGTSYSRVDSSLKSWLDLQIVYRIPRSTRPRHGK